MPPNDPMQSFSVPPVGMQQPVTPFQYLPTVVHADGTINWTTTDVGFGQGFNSSLDQLGQGIGGQTGIPGLKTGLGYAYDRSVKQFGYSIEQNLNVGLGKAMDPSYSPIADTDLDKTRGWQYWNTGVHPMVKRVLADHGLDSHTLTGQTGMQTKDRINSALKQIEMADTQAQYDKNNFRFGPARVARFIGADLIGNVLTDPTMLLTLGASKGATMVAKGAAIGLEAGSKEALSIAAKAGTNSALKQSAQASAKLLAGMTKALGSDQTKSLMSKWYVRYGSSALTNQFIGLNRGIQATNEAQAAGDFTPKYTTQNGLTDIGMGIFLPGVVDGALAGLTKYQGRTRMDKVLAQGMVASGPKPITFTDQNLIGSPSIQVGSKVAGRQVGGIPNLITGAERVNQFRSVFSSLHNQPQAYPHTWGSVDWIARAQAAGVDMDKQLQWFKNHPQIDKIDQRTQLIEYMIKQQKPTTSPVALQELGFRRVGNKAKGIPSVSVDYKFNNQVDHALVLLTRQNSDITSLQKAQLLDFVRRSTGLNDDRIRQLAKIVNQQVKDRAVKAANTAKTPSSTGLLSIDQLDPQGVYAVVGKSGKPGMPMTGKQQIQVTGNLDQVDLDYIKFHEARAAKGDATSKALAQNTKAQLQASKASNQKFVQVFQINGKPVGPQTKALPVGQGTPKLQLPSVWQQFVNLQGPTPQFLSDTKMKGIDLQKYDISKLVNDSNTTWAQVTANEPKLQQQLQALLSQKAQGVQDAKKISDIKKKLKLVSDIRQRAQTIGTAKVDNLPTDTGLPLSQNSANQVLDSLNNKGQLFPPIGQMWQQHNRADRIAKQLADWLVSKSAGNGLYDIQHNTSGVVRRLGKWILAGQDALADTNSRRTIRSLERMTEQVKIQAAAAISEYDYIRNSLPREQVDRIQGLVHNSLNTGERLDMTSGKFKTQGQLKVYQSMVGVGQKYFSARRQRDLLSGRLGSIQTFNYLPRYFKSSAVTQISNLSRRFHETWAKGWSQPDAPVHIKTLKALGYGADHARDGNMLPIGQDIGQIAKLTYSELPPTLKARYTQNLRSKDGVIALQANKAVRTLNGQPTHIDLTTAQGWILATQDDKIPGVKIDTTKSRSIHDSVFEDPQVSKHLQKNIGSLIHHYGNTSAPQGALKEWIKDITGRKDITWDQFWYYAQAAARKDATGQYSKQVQRGLSALQSKVHSMMGLYRLQDDDLYKVPQTLLGVPQKLVVSAINAKEGLQTICTDFIPTMVMGPMEGPQFTSGVLDVLKALMSGDKADIQGFAHVIPTMRQMAMSGITQSQIPIRQSSKMFQQIRNASGQFMQVLKSSQPDLPQKISNSLLAGAQVINVASRVLGGGDVAHLATSVGIARAQATRLSQNFSRVVAASQKLKPLLQSSKVITSQDIKGIARHSGIDVYSLTKMRNAGLLDPQVVNSLKQLNSLDPEFISKPTVGKTFDYTHAHDVLQKIKDPVESVKAEKALSIVRDYLQGKIDQRTARPSYGTLDTSKSNSFFKKMWKMFTSYSTAFYEQRVKSGFMNQAHGNAYLKMSLAMLGQFIWYNANKMLYRGYTYDDIKDQMTNHLPATLGAFAVRTPMAGPLGTFMMAAQGAFGKQKSSQTPQSTAVGATRSLINLIKAGTDQNKNAKPRDLDGLLKLFPIVNLPYMQASAKIAGYSSPGNWILDHQPTK